MALIRDEAGVEVARATALRFRTATGPDDAGTDPVLPPIETPPFGAVRAEHAHPEGRSGFAGALETRDGGDRGQATSWYRATRPVIAGEEPSPMVRLAWASDFTANSGNFLDLDPVVGDQRRPHDQPLPRAGGGVDRCHARAWYVEDGIGLARAELFDLDGYVGTCTAALLVDEVAVPYSS